MIYKLYKDTTRTSEPVDLDIFNEFKSIYEENNVNVVGLWQNESKTNEFFFMTAYRDAEHYNSFVESMKTHERYQELSRKLEEERESIEAIELKDVFP